jgi:cytochrome c553
MTTRKAILIAATMFAATPVSNALAEGDAAAGEKAFNKCKACHTVEQGGERTGSVPISTALSAAKPVRWMGSHTPNPSRKAM